MFGENLTTEGLLDENVSVGDRFRVGTAELVVTQSRLPCPSRLDHQVDQAKMDAFGLRSG